MVQTCSLASVPLTNRSMNAVRKAKMTNFDIKVVSDPICPWVRAHPSSILPRHSF